MTANGSCEKYEPKEFLNINTGEVKREKVEEVSESIADNESHISTSLVTEP